MDVCPHDEFQGCPYLLTNAKREAKEEYVSTLDKKGLGLKQGLSCSKTQRESVIRSCL